MRKIVVAMLAVAGIGMIGMANGSAAPAVGASPVRAQDHVNDRVKDDRVGDSGALLQQIRYYRYRGHACYTKCYRDFVIGPRVCRTYC